MQKIEFYFDPSCPWCWVTSRWIKQVASKKLIIVSWCSFSLLEKNKGEMPKKYLKSAQYSHSLLRVIEAARAKLGEGLVDQLYTGFGENIHNQSDYEIDSVIGIIKELSPEESEYLISALDDTKWDKAIIKSMAEVEKIVGNDVGVPIIIFKNKNKKVGYFGPVLSELPKMKDGLELWDGLVKLAGYEHFYELKRTRDVSPKIPEKSNSKANPNVCSLDF